MRDLLGARSGGPRLGRVLEHLAYRGDAVWLVTLSNGSVVARVESELDALPECAWATYTRQQFTASARIQNVTTLQVDLTAWLLALDRDEIAALQDDGPGLQHARSLDNHSGPARIDLVSAARRYFGVHDLARVDDALLTEARSIRVGVAPAGPPASQLTRTVSAYTDLLARAAARPDLRPAAALLSGRVAELNQAAFKALPEPNDVNGLQRQLRHAREGLLAKTAAERDRIATAVRA
ncbi:hypothetical protein CKO28_13700 [Rhodovibrio sodomensis]|uniref:SCP2 domain-containing protein n=1 Tax=Rhodovibrio sodomensis TaxID=1088 RepID=A0ABS1DFR6_9PROT|nr:hypothetical protein [Rhodovibrio sodomensis]